MTIIANKSSETHRNASSLGRIREMGVYVGIVKDNVDAQRMGRVAVFIPELGGDPEDSRNWFIVGYASPFAGATRSKDQRPDGTEYGDGGGQTSYGFWAQAPDLENHVLVAFAGGDVAQGYMFASIYQHNMNHMVPSIPSGKPIAETDTGDGLQPPVIEYNKASETVTPTDPNRAVFTPLHEGLSKQGLYKDAERGPAQKGARSSAPSTTTGFNTARGNTIYVEDDPENEFIRLRTRSGAQVLVHETNGSVYINSKDGNSWASISDHGIDLYSKGAISARTEGSFNLHADASFNIQADGNLNLRAGGNLTMQAAAGIHAGCNGVFAIGTSSKFSLSGGEVHVGAGGALRLGSGGDMSMGSGGAQVRSGSIIRDNVGSAPSPNCDAPTLPQAKTHKDIDGEGPAYNESSRRSIARRLPTHEPYHGHSGAAEAGGGTERQNEEYASPSDETTASEAVAENGETVETTPTTINATDEDWLALTIFTEAEGESDDGKAAVAWSIKCRMDRRFSENAPNPRFSGVTSICLAYAAFSYFWSTDGSRLNNGLKDGDRARYGSHRNNRNHPVWKRGEDRGLARMRQVKNTAMFAKCKEIGKQVMAGQYQPKTQGLQTLMRENRALWYINPAHASPSWESDKARVVKIGNHQFFKPRR